MASNKLLLHDFWFDTDGVNKAPTPPNSRMSGDAFGAKVLAGVWNGHLHSINLYQYNIGSIGALLLVGCPIAIARLVVSIAVSPLDCVILWPAAHVFKKARKRCAPLFANGYALCSVPLVTCVRFFIAATNNPSPYFKGGIELFRFGPRFVSFDQLLFFQASAAQATTFAQGSPAPNHGSAAVTQTAPNRRGIANWTRRP